MQIGIIADAPNLAKLPAGIAVDFLEGWVAECLLPEQDDAAFAPVARALRAHRLPMPASNRFYPAHLKVIGPDVDAARLDRHAAVAVRRAKEVGMSVIVFGSGPARTAPAGFSLATAFEQFVGLLQRIAPEAHRHGVTIVVEPLQRGESSIVNTILEGAEAVRRANHPAIQLLVDSFHMVRNGESFDDILNVAPLIRHAHISEDRDRAPLGTHGDDLRPFLRALRRAGYDERLALEPVWTDIATQASPCVAELRRQMADAGY
jgi:sugar phosphate isomerase/epimerase